MPRVPLALLCALVAGEAAEAAAPGPVNPDPGVRTYRCEDGQVIEAGYPTRDTAVVKADGRPHPMQAQIAASGVRYVGYGLQWWTKGMSEGRLSRLKPGETIASDPGVLCRVQAETPAGRADAAPAATRGAAQVAQSYFALIGQRRYADAWRLWAPGAVGRARSSAEFAAQFDRYTGYRAQVGPLGPVEGAAGSLYVEAPVTIHARLKTGQEVSASGRMTLRRVNDVPGSTPAQRRWGIYRIELER